MRVCRGAPRARPRATVFAATVFADVPEIATVNLQLDYSSLDASQFEESLAAAHRAGLSDPRAVTFIPSVIVEFETFWKTKL